jgi:thiamine biosynthesis lipoprotein
MIVPRRGLSFLFVLSSFLAACWNPTCEEVSWGAKGGDVPASVRVCARTEGDASKALEEMRRQIETAEENMLSGPDAGALGELNRGAAEGYFTVEDRDLYRCVLLALDYAKASEGAFDPTVGPLLKLYRRVDAAVRPPRSDEIEGALAAVGWAKVAVADEARAVRFRRPAMFLDLGGVAKGFALDTAARAFARPGSLGGLLRFGNDFYAWGESPDGAGWNVALPDPRDPERTLIRVRTSNRGVAVSGHPAPGTSGPSRRERVVLDPGTGLPAATDLIAAVAIADSAADADALSTALFVSGSMRGAALLERMRRSEAVLVVRGDGQSPHLVASVSLRGRIELSPELSAETGGRVRYLLPPDKLSP